MERSAGDFLRGVVEGLQNQLPAKQIELLEKSQEYRCCPAAQEED